jgi:hypothetical protein
MHLFTLLSVVTLMRQGSSEGESHTRRSLESHNSLVKCRNISIALKIPPGVLS